MKGASRFSWSIHPQGDHASPLFLAGFLIALAMQPWNLHRRVAITLPQMARAEMRINILAVPVVVLLL